MSVSGNVDLLAARVAEEFNTVRAEKADATHTHSISQVTNLQDELDGKSDVGHTHAGQTGSLDLDILRVGLATRDAGPRLLVYAGSSTVEGANASIADRRFVNLLTKAIQDAYPLRSGEASPPMRTLQQAYDNRASLTPGVQGVNAGNGGTTAANYLSATEINQIGELEPLMIMHVVGSNDMASGRSPATYQADLENMIADLDAVLSKPHIHVLVLPFERMDGPFTYPWSDYGAAMAAIAAANPGTVVYIDISGPYYSVGVPGSDPFDLIDDTEPYHLNDNGHALMADLLRSQLGIDVVGAISTAPADTQDPTTPTGLTATPGDGVVDLSWNASTDNVGVTGYRVYRDGALLASPTGLSHSDTTVTNGTEYSYTVSAVDAAGNESPQSAAVTATPVSSGGPTVLFQDDFNRADGPLTSPWVTDDGVYEIQAGKVVGTSQGYVTVDTGQTSYEVSAVLNVTSHAGSTPGLMFAYASSSSRLGVYLNETSVQLLASGASAPTFATYNTTVNTGQDYTIRIVFNGASIEVFLDGASIITHTLSTADQATFLDGTHTRVGFRGTQTTYDNLIVTAIA